MLARAMEWEECIMEWDTARWGEWAQWDTDTEWEDTHMKWAIIWDHMDIPHLDTMEGKTTVYKCGPIVKRVTVFFIVEGK